MSKRNVALGADNDSKNLLNKFALNKPGVDSKGILSKYAGGAGGAKDEEIKDVDENVGARNIPVNRKNRNNLKNIEEIPKGNVQITVNTKSQYNDLPIMAAIKQTKRKSSDFKMEEGDNTPKK